MAAPDGYQGNLLDPSKTHPIDFRDIRTFSTGATRDTDALKNDYEGYLSPVVIVRFGDYMTVHRKQSNGQLRDSDNWQKGIPRKQYLKSLWRHFLDLWLIQRGHIRFASSPDVEDTLCAVMFNTMGLLHEIMIGRDCE